MAKHVFEINDYGSCWHRGEYTGETEKMFIYRSGLKLRKASKRMHVVVECEDPAVPVARYYAADKQFADKIDAAQAGLMALQKAAKKAARDALIGGAS